MSYVLPKRRALSELQGVADQDLKPNQRKSSVDDLLAGHL